MSLPSAIADDPHALVVLDWSGWIHRAWHVGGLEKLASIVVGWLVRLLADPMPPSLVVAVDPLEPTTFRHRATRDLPEEKRYKAGRPAKTPEFLAVNERLQGLLYLHGIPILWPEEAADVQTFEADDAAAAAVKRAQAEGRSVALVTVDKDWCQLITNDPTRPCVIRWNGGDVVDDEAGVIARWGVRPEQLVDLFALMGDSVDNVPGVRGIGPKTARELLETYGSLDGALAAEPSTRPLRLLHEQRAEALFSRSLIQLWADAPILWEPEQQPVGGFDVPAISRLYRDFGFTQLAESIPQFPKAVW